MQNLIKIYYQEHQKMINQVNLIIIFNFKVINSDESYNKWFD